MKINTSFQRRRQDAVSLLTVIIVCAIMFIVGGIIIHFIRKWAEKLNGTPNRAPQTNDTSFGIPEGVSNVQFRALSLEFKWIEYPEGDTAADESFVPFNAPRLCILFDTNGVLTNWLDAIPKEWKNQSLAELGVELDYGGIPVQSSWSSPGSEPGVQVEVLRSTNNVTWQTIGSIGVEIGVTNYYFDSEPPAGMVLYKTVIRQ